MIQLHKNRPTSVVLFADGKPSTAHSATPSFLTTSNHSPQTNGDIYNGHSPVMKVEDIAWLCVLIGTIIYYEVRQWSNKVSTDNTATRNLREAGSQTNDIHPKRSQISLSHPMAYIITQVHRVGDNARLRGLRRSDRAVCAELQIIKIAVSETVHAASYDMLG